MGTIQSKTGSIAGPLILIAVGVLFLLHNLTGFEALMSFTSLDSTGL